MGSNVKVLNSVDIYVFYGRNIGKVWDWFSGKNIVSKKGSVMKSKIVQLAKDYFAP